MATEKSLLQAMESSYRVLINPEVLLELGTKKTEIRHESVYA